MAEILIEKGHPNSVSDAGVAAEVAVAGVKGACMNILINLSDIDNHAYRDDKRKSVETLILKVQSLEKVVYEKTIGKIKS